MMDPWKLHCGSRRVGRGLRTRARPLAASSGVTLRKLLTLAEPQFSHLLTGISVPLSWSVLIQVTRGSVMDM